MGDIEWRKERAIVFTWPKVYPAPLGDIPQPQRSSGSDHKRSHMGPSWGTSWTRSKLRMLSRVSMDGDNPPWRQNISDSTFKTEKTTYNNGKLQISTKTMAEQLKYLIFTYQAWGSAKVVVGEIKKYKSAFSTLNMKMKWRILENKQIGFKLVVEGVLAERTEWSALQVLNHWPWWQWW